VRHPAEPGRVFELTAILVAYVLLLAMLAMHRNLVAEAVGPTRRCTPAAHGG